MNKNFIINERDILEVYKIEGKLKEYNYCKDYVKLMNMNTKKTLKEEAIKFCVNYNSLLRWKSKKRTPYGIKCLEFLRERNLLPYYPNEKTARIVGFLHGDGYLLNSITSFGFVSKDRRMLIKLKKDVETEFKIKGNLEKKRDKGDIETIHNKKFLVKSPTYIVEFNNKAVSSLLFKLGVPRGKKIYQNTFVPAWVMKGNNEIKKAFLQGLFDSELCNASISTYERHIDNLSSPRMEMGKINSLEGNLRDYLNQIKYLLGKLGINSKVVQLRRYAKNKISLTLSINNKLSNLYNFTEKVGFYYNKERIKKSKIVQKLALEKIKNKNIIYKILNYCKNKNYFTLQDLEKDLNMPEGSTKLMGLYLYNTKLATRKRNKNRWFYYYPNFGKINKIIDNPLLLETLPRLLEWNKKIN